MTTRERAWNAVHDALPDGWRVGPPTWDPSVARGPSRPAYALLDAVCDARDDHGHRRG